MVVNLCPLCNLSLNVFKFVQYLIGVRRAADAELRCVDVGGVVKWRHTGTDWRHAPVSHYVCRAQLDADSTSSRATRSRCWCCCRCSPDVAGDAVCSLPFWQTKRTSIWSGVHKWVTQRLRLILDEVLWWQLMNGWTDWIWTVKVSKMTSRCADTLQVFGRRMKMALAHILVMAVLWIRAGHYILNAM